MTARSRAGGVVRIALARGAAGAAQPVGVGKVPKKLQFSMRES